MDDIVYDIEEIISHRKRPDGKYEYFVKWKVILISYDLILCFVVVAFKHISKIAIQMILLLLLHCNKTVINSRAMTKAPTLGNLQKISKTQKFSKTTTIRFVPLPFRRN